MQDRYVGDIGDFVKLALLRALMPGHRLGVAWWLFPDESINGNGRHVDYLAQRSKWRHFDPDLFDGLAQIVVSGRRNVSALQSGNLLPGAIFFDELIPTEGTPAQRRVSRLEWLKRIQSHLADRDLIFIDPDNGLETDGFSDGAVSAGKSVSLAQLAALRAPGRTLIIYHHHTRRKGGHIAEITYWADRLRNNGFQIVDAIRARPFSPRVFFLLNPDAAMREHARQLTVDWGDKLSWHPDPAGG